MSVGAFKFGVMNPNRLARKFFDKYFAPTPLWPRLQQIRYFFLTFIVTCAAIGVMKIVPNVFPGDKNPWNPSLGYWVLAIVFMGLIRWFGVQQFTFVCLPALDWRTGVGIVIATVFVWSHVNVGQFTHRSLASAVTGLVFILSIGLGEEFVSRGFTYGMYARFGDKFAILASSAIFGFMHISWYMGKYWDPWAAYWHITNAAAFGLFACCLMIVTRSIWPGIIMHGLIDWDLGFDPKAISFPKAGHVTHSELWSGLFAPAPYALSYVVPGVILFYLGRRRVPRFVSALAVKWKLVEVNG
ncbi:COG1266 Predicted metal-dependent membrane protease [Candidatus Nanopelagicaceae bacterium]